MKRKIKFKAWHKKKKEFIEYFCINPEGSIFDSDDEGDELNPNLILMQYTGLKDKNGKKIYESDILKVNYNPYDANNEGMTLKGNSVEFNARVIFKNGSFWAAANCKYRQLLLTMFERKEIIGNIYENSNLIK